jgi:hypothetical protein
MSEDVSRRKMLSLLGLGAVLGFTLSAAVEPLEAEAQTVAQAAPAAITLYPLRQTGPWKTIMVIEREGMMAPIFER